jgi:hypothetical protein
MVKMRHVAEIPEIGFAVPVGLPPGLEVMPLPDLRGRAADRMGADSMRPGHPPASRQRRAAAIRVQITSGMLRSGQQVCTLERDRRVTPGAWSKTPISSSTSAPSSTTP